MASKAGKKWRIPRCCDERERGSSPSVVRAVVLSLVTRSMIKRKGRRCNNGGAASCCNNTVVLVKLLCEITPNFSSFLVQSEEVDVCVCERVCVG